MTDSDLRELDGWIAEHFLGWKLIKDSDPPAWITSPGGSVVTYDTTSFSDAFRPSTLPSAFALVKREIERRGWGWRCERDVDPSLAFKFELFIPKGHPDEQIDPIVAYDESEELAGCLAVKAALEGSK